MSILILFLLFLFWVNDFNYFGHKLTFIFIIQLQFSINSIQTSLNLDLSNQFNQFIFRLDFSLYNFQSDCLPWLFLRSFRNTTIAAFSNQFYNFILRKYKIPHFTVHSIFVSSQTFFRLQSLFIVMSTFDWRFAGLIQWLNFLCIHLNFFLNFILMNIFFVLIRIIIKNILVVLGWYLIIFILLTQLNWSI